MGKFRVFIIVIFIIFAFLLTGCGNKSVNITNNISEKDYTQVFNHIKVETFRAVLSDGTPWAPLAISDNNEIFGYTAAVKGNLSNIISCNIKTHNADILYSIKDNYQPEFLEFNDNYLLCTEYLPPNGGGDVRVVLYDRKSKTEKTLNIRVANVTQISDDQIALGDNYVLWSSGTIDSNNKVTYKIYKYNISNAETSIFKENAVKPVIGNNFIAWIGPDDDGSNYGAVYVQNLKDNSIKKISKSINSQYLAAHGDMLVYSGSVPSTSSNPKMSLENKLIFYNNGVEKVIDKSKNYDFEFPYISNNYISWDQISKKRVYCINSNTIADLQSDYGEAFVSNNYIMWATDAIENESKDQAVSDGMYLTEINLMNTYGK